MAKPDCDDGYYKLSYELGAALFSFGFGEIEGHIIGLVLEAQYGFGKRKFVELSPANLSAEWEVPRQNIHRAIGNLVARNVLLPLGDNRYQFLKDYENWDKKGRPARVLLWKAFVADAPRRAKSIKPLPAPRERDDLILEGVPGVNDEPEPVISKDDTSSMPDETPSSSKMTTRHLQRLPTVISKDDEQGVPPRPPIEESRAELRIGEVKNKSALTREDSDGGKPRLSVFEAEHDMLAGIDFEPGEHEPDRAELFRAACFIETQFDSRCYAMTSAMYRKARRYPNAWFIKALIKGRHSELTAQKHISSFEYFVTILDDWLAIGRPAAGPWDDYDDDMNLINPEAHKALHRATRQASWKATPAVKPTPLPPEVKAPADWDLPEGVPNPYSKLRKPDCA